jgi:hypothetical protein
VIPVVFSYVDDGIQLMGRWIRRTPAQTDLAKS